MNDLEPVTLLKAIELREQIAMKCLVAMITTNGHKDEKVRASFDYADIFIRESILRRQRDTESIVERENDGD